MSAKKTEIPICHKGCNLPHSLSVAMRLLDVGKTRLYELMNDRVIEYLDTDYGRRIRHDVITHYLETHSIKPVAANADEQLRKNS